MDLHIVRLIGEVLMIGIGLAFAGSAAWIGRRIRVRAERLALVGIALACAASSMALYDLHTVGLITASTARALEWVQWLLLAVGTGCVILNMMMGPLRS